MNGNMVQVKSFRMESGRRVNLNPFPSISQQAWNIPLATKLGIFQGPPSLEPFIGHQVRGPSLPPSFFFSLKAWILIFWFSILECDFRFEPLRICSCNFPYKENDWLVLTDGEKRDIITLNHSSTFERVKMNRGGFRTWNFGEIL
jgi:hypothetical protein